MSHTAVVATLLLAPFIGFLINGLRNKQHGPLTAGIIATAAVGISFLCTVSIFLQLLKLSGDARSISVSFFDWITVGDLRIAASFVLDQLSVTMALVITGVGVLIHLFSIGYMHDDPGVAKYFSYLNLFVFNMLILVLGDSLPLVFVGWEGVGLCSYLLIGFWFTDKEKAAAGMKAFITNRVGDAAFILGMFVLFFSFGTLDMHTLNQLASGTVEQSWLAPATLGTLLLFIGATGKSAQIPLYVWLPDAMAGPTPVSALIHAATMVTAGVYMICRLNGLFLAAPNTLFVIAIVGVLTALLGATIGITQWDIKKVLAYSTVSQLGFMFLATGVGAFTAAMFHLVTHAFFKALMFLGSGSVIHSMHGEQDIRKMGGLRREMPITHITFLFGWLAIIGAPPFAGFFSKDEILWLSYHSPLGHVGLWITAAFVAALTAFYMTRLMCLTFWGKSRVPKEIHPHESPWTMTVPLAVLGILSIVGGWMGIPHIIGEILPGHPPNILAEWLAPVIRPIPGIQAGAAAVEWALMGISVLLAAVASFAAWVFYVKRTDLPAIVANKISGVYRLVSKKYLVDEIYQKTLIEPVVSISKNLWSYVDVNFVDRATVVISELVKGAGSVIRTTQSGNMQQYAMMMVLGLVVLLSFILMR